MLPLVERIAAELDVIVSVDTSSPELMTAAAARGWPAERCAGAGSHRRGGCRCRHRPADLPYAYARGARNHAAGSPITAMWWRRCGISWPGELPSVRRGIARRLALDPAFGFGKTVRHNLLLLDGLPGLLPRWVCRCWWGCHANP